MLRTRRPTVPLKYKLSNFVDSFESSPNTSPYVHLLATAATSPLAPSHADPCVNLTRTSRLPLSLADAYGGSARAVVVLLLTPDVTVEDVLPSDVVDLFAVSDVRVWSPPAWSDAAMDMLQALRIVVVPPSSQFLFVTVSSIQPPNSKRYDVVFQERITRGTTTAFFPQQVWVEVMGAIESQDKLRINIGAHIPRRLGHGHRSAMATGRWVLRDSVPGDTYQYTSVMTPRELVAAIGDVHAHMYAIVMRKQPGKCNLHVEDLAKVTEMLFTRRWPTMQSTWRDYYKLESYLNRQSDNTRHRVVTAFHNPSRMLSQRQDALMVLLDLYSAKMLVREVRESVLPEMREIRAMQNAEKDLKKMLFVERLRVEDAQRDLNRRAAIPLTEYGVSLPPWQSVVKAGMSHNTVQEELAQAAIRKIVSTLSRLDAAKCRECNLNPPNHRLTPCKHMYCSSCAEKMLVCMQCMEDLKPIPKIDGAPGSPPRVSPSGGRGHGQGGYHHRHRDRHGHGGGHHNVHNNHPPVIPDG